MGEEENAAGGAVVLEMLERKLGLISSQNWCVPNLNEPRSFDEGAPLLDFSARDTWSHANEKEVSIDVCESQTGRPVFPEVEFTYVDLFFKSIEVWAW